MIPEIPRPPAPEPGQLQIWKADLEAWAHYASQLRSLLSAGEVERLERLKVPAKREQLTLSRGLLRLLLGAYLGQPPAQLEIHSSPQGKPYLPDQRLAFNISHSGNRLLCACGYYQNIGVDLQEVYRISGLESIIERHFSQAERDYLADQAFPREAFFELWTAKEAYLKGVGMGFQSSSRAVSLLPDACFPGRYRVRGASQASQLWTVIDLEVGDGFKAAAAADGEIADAALLPLLPPESPPQKDSLPQ